MLPVDSTNCFNSAHPEMLFYDSLFAQLQYNQSPVFCFTYNFGIPHNYLHVRHMC